MKTERRSDTFTCRRVHWLLRENKVNRNILQELVVSRLLIAAAAAVSGRGLREFVEGKRETRRARAPARSLSRPSASWNKVSLYVYCVCERPEEVHSSVTKRTMDSYAWANYREQRLIIKVHPVEESTLMVFSLPSSRSFSRSALQSHCWCSSAPNRAGRLVSWVTL